MPKFAMVVGNDYTRVRETARMLSEREGYTMVLDEDIRREVEADPAKIALLEREADKADEEERPYREGKKPARGECHVRLIHSREQLRADLFNGMLNNEVYGRIKKHIEAGHDVLWGNGSYRRFWLAGPIQMAREWGADHVVCYCIRPLYEDEEFETPTLVEGFDEIEFF